MNKQIYAASNLWYDLVQDSSQAKVINYDASILTGLCRDIFGGNSLTIGMFLVDSNVNNNNFITLDEMEKVAEIVTYPV